MSFWDRKKIVYMRMKLLQYVLIELQACADKQCEINCMLWNSSYGKFSLFF